MLKINPFWKRKRKPLQRLIEYVKNQTWSYYIVELIMLNDIEGLKIELNKVKDVTNQLNFPSLYWTIQNESLDKNQIGDSNSIIQEYSNHYKAFKALFNRDNENAHYSEILLNEIGLEPTPLTFAIMVAKKSRSFEIVELLLNLDVDVKFYHVLLAITLRWNNSDMLLKLLLKFDSFDVPWYDMPYVKVYMKRSPLTYKDEDSNGATEFMAKRKANMERMKVLHEAYSTRLNYGSFNSIRDSNATLNTETTATESESMDRSSKKQTPSCELKRCTRTRLKGQQKFTVKITPQERELLIEKLNVTVFSRTMFGFIITMDDPSQTLYLLSIIPWPNAPYDNSLLSSLVTHWNCRDLYNLLKSNPYLLTKMCRTSNETLLEMILKQKDHMLFNWIVKENYFYNFLREHMAKLGMSLIHYLGTELMRQTGRPNERRSWVMKPHSAEIVFDSFRRLIKLNCDISRVLNRKSLLHTFLLHKPIPNENWMEAIRLDAVVLLIKAGIDINQEYFTQTPLHLASMNNLMWCCKTLIDAGANTLALNGDKLDVLSVAGVNDVPRLSLMLKHGSGVMKLSHICLQKIRLLRQSYLLGDYMKTRFGIDSN
ncbi:hypothetical protein BC833DRAFT_602915 [Globomyces pollinis-pini]|nr:hypothetical protein BC833DRAFT_602915 [Globomyces pollinis-pini]